jgi:hypothetical protein
MNNIDENDEQSIIIKKKIQNIVEENIFDVNIEYDEHENIKKINLYTYICKYLPKILVKKVLNIYEDDSDKENLDKISIEDLLKIISSSLSLNKSHIINTDSRVIKTMEETTIPFFIEHIKKSIEMLRDGVNNYLKFVHTQGTHLQTLNLLCL